MGGIPPHTSNKCSTAEASPSTYPVEYLHQLLQGNWVNRVCRWHWTGGTFWGVWDRDSPQWAERNLMKFDKDKCIIRPLPLQQGRLGQLWWILGGLDRQQAKCEPLVWPKIVSSNPCWTYRTTPREVILPHYLTCTSHAEYIICSFRPSNAWKTLDN